MTIYYCGIGGNNGNSGTSWANRKADPNGVEDIPVVAGDFAWIGPGTYRMTHTLDVSGTAGNPITFAGDVTGEHTDGVGGIIRYTGSDNDTTATRTNCITATGRNYRVFRGISFDTATGILTSFASNSSNTTIEDCIYNTQITGNVSALSFNGTGTGQTVRRCIFHGVKTTCINFTHTATVDNTGSLVENCLFVGTSAIGVSDDRVGGITVKNCDFIGTTTTAVRVVTALTAGQTITVNNCVFVGCLVAVQATVTGEIVENYNTIFATNTARTNVSTGANSDIFPVPRDFGRLLSGLNLVGRMFAQAAWSQVKQVAGTGESTDDLYGKTRPTTSAKNSRGAIQYVDTNRETTTTRTGGVSLKLSDAGRHQMYVPVSNVSTVFSVYVQWEADYTGTKPQMVVKQPGQSDTTVTATGSSGSWELLTTTLTPAASPGYVIVEFCSSNTAASTNFRAFFDDFSAV